MSAQGPLSPASAPRQATVRTAAAVLAAILIGLAVFGAGWWYGGRRVLTSAWSPAGNAVAYLLETPCLHGPCQSLWIGVSIRQARRVETLRPDSERCDEIAWTPDGGRVGFLINGYQLRVFDGATGSSRGAVTLVEPDGTPPSRIARGVTFSINGAAVTFDDCARTHSGCRPGLVALR